MVSHSLGQILVALLVMQRQSCLEGGWEWPLCFPFVEVILRLTLLIMSPGLSGKRFVFLMF